MLCIHAAARVPESWKASTFLSCILVLFISWIHRPKQKRACDGAERSRFIPKEEDKKTALFFSTCCSEISHGRPFYFVARTSTASTKLLFIMDIICQILKNSRLLDFSAFCSRHYPYDSVTVPLPLIADQPLIIASSTGDIVLRPEFCPLKGAFQPPAAQPKTRPSPTFSAKLDDLGLRICALKTLKARSRSKASSTMHISSPCTLRRHQRDLVVLWAPPITDHVASPGPGTRSMYRSAVGCSHPRSVSSLDPPRRRRRQTSAGATSLRVLGRVAAIRAK